MASSMSLLAVLAVAMMCIYATEGVFVRPGYGGGCANGRFWGGSCHCNSGYGWNGGACAYGYGLRPFGGKFFGHGKFFSGGGGNGGSGGNGGNGGTFGNGGSGGHGGNGGPVGNGGSGGNGGHAGQGKFGHGPIY